MATEEEFGNDFGGVDDIDLTTELIGVELLANDIACRLMSPLGGVIDAPSYGFDLRQYLSANETPRTRAEIVAGVTAQVLADERVTGGVTVTIEFSGAYGDRTLFVDIAGVCDLGPFAFTLAASAVSTAILEKGDRL